MQNKTFYFSRAQCRKIGFTNKKVTKYTIVFFVDNRAGHREQKDKGLRGEPFFFIVFPWQKSRLFCGL